MPIDCSDDLLPVASVHPNHSSSLSATPILPVNKKNRTETAVEYAAQPNPRAAGLLRLGLATAPKHQPASRCSSRRRHRSAARARSAGGAPGRLARTWPARLSGVGGGFPRRAWLQAGQRCLVCGKTTGLKPLRLCFRLLPTDRGCS